MSMAMFGTFRQHPIALDLICYRVYLYRAEDNTIQVNDYTKPQYDLVETAITTKGNPICQVYKGFKHPDELSKDFQWKRYGALDDNNTSIEMLINQGTQVIYNG